MKVDRRRAGRHASILAGAVALALSFVAFAQDLTFDIRAGDLKATLEAYAKQTGQQLVYQPDDIKGKTSPGVHGEMTAEQALKALLAGTGLKVSRDSSGAIAIFPAEALAGAASSEKAGDGEKLEEIIVTATEVSQIYVTSRSATRLDTDPMKLPLSISAVQGNLLRDQQARTLTDALNNVAGLDVSGRDEVTTRGFEASVARNGTVQTGFLGYYNNSRPNVATDRIEVVKGPEQIMQGSTAGIGGTVNLITKVPQAQSSAYIGSALGSEGYRRLDADVNGTLLGDGGNRLMGRLIGSTSDAGKTEVGYDGASNDFVSAGLRQTYADWGTDMSVVYEYNKVSQPDPPIVVVQDGKFHSGMQEYALGPDNAHDPTTDDTVDVNISQRLWQDWTLGVNYIYRDSHSAPVEGLPLFVLGDTVATLGFEGPAYAFHITANDVKVDLRGQFKTGQVGHKLMLSYDYNSNRTYTPAGQYSPGSYYTDLATSQKTFVPDPGSDVANDIRSHESGVLLVDQLSWGSWSGLFGVRRVNYDTIWYRVDWDSKNEPANATLPQYGVAYQITPDISVYASGGEGFRSNAGSLDYLGNQLANETSTQFEGGMKALLLNKQIALTVAAYRIKQDNVVASDPDPNHHPVTGCCAYILIPGLTSKGIEVEAAGQPIRGLMVRANYTYTHQQDQDGSPPQSGYIPREFNLWAQYWLRRNVGTGWWGAVGLSAEGAAVESPSSPQIPGSALVDLQAGYSGPHWGAIAGAKNIGHIQTLYPTYQYGEFGTVRPKQTYTFDLNYRF